MSSVVISGDTSGSVTLSAPATAGSTVLTLPATSGTVITGPGGVTSVASGGTGASTLTANNVILGNGTSAVAFVAPGSSGNVLTSDGTTWASTAAASGQLKTELFTAPGTWTKPASCTQVRVTVVGGGAAGQYQGQAGGNGGYAQAIVPVSAPVAITVGTGGNSAVTPNAPSASGNTSSFGSAVSATGGGGGYPTTGVPGTGTVTTGTAIKSGPSATYLSAAMGGFLFGRISIPSSGFTPNVAYSTSGANQAGASGTGSGLTNASGGCGGAVVVEFVG